MCDFANKALDSSTLVISHYKFSLSGQWVILFVGQSQSKLTTGSGTECIYVISINIIYMTILLWLHADLSMFY